MFEETRYSDIMFFLLPSSRRNNNAQAPGDRGRITVFLEVPGTLVHVGRFRDTLSGAASTLAGHLAWVAGGKGMHEGTRYTRI